MKNMAVDNSHGPAVPIMAETAKLRTKSVCRHASMLKRPRKTSHD